MTAPSLWRRIGNTLAQTRRRSRICTIDLVDDGFVLTVRKRPRRVPWSDIVRIDAGIRDYVSSDELYFVMATAKLQLEIQELDDGFRLFELELFARWPQIREPIETMQRGNPHEPAFATVWRR